MIHDSDVERWLREDVGHHDVTNDLPGETGGRLVARENCTLAGLDAAVAVFEYLECDVTERPADGDLAAEGDTVLSVSGPTRDVLRGERPAVNLVAHASGVATRTRAAIDAAAAAVPDEESVPRIAATRKTTPGLRGVEKRAVAAAGGDTHRLDLSHMVMVKDNHVAEVGLERAVERMADRASFATKIEVEVEDPDRAGDAAAAGADVVLLDNMTPGEVSEAVGALPDGVIAEASGGIALETVGEYATTGVDVLSMGALTHSAPAVDLSFRTGDD